MFNLRWVFRSPLLVLLVLLQACGGGGGGGTPLAPPSGLSYASPHTYAVGVAITALTPTVNGSVSNYGVTPALPPGLTLNTSTGLISGTPTATTPQAAYTVSASNSAGSGTFVLTITVQAATSPAPSGLSYPNPQAYVVGVAITALTPTVNGSVSNYGVTPALPPGLTLNTSTGLISGTPTAATPQAAYTVSASNSAGSGTFVLTITVQAATSPAPSGLSYPSPQAYVVGTAITPLDPTVTGAVTSYNVTPALPTGLSLDSSNGRISGTPTAVAAQAPYRMTASNAHGNTTFDVVIAVTAPVSAGFTVGGTVTGLSGSGLVLRLNGANDLAVSTNGQFQFVLPLASGAAYSVAVQALPRNPTQACSIANGIGTIAAANIVNIVVNCTAVYRVGGTIINHLGSGLILSFIDNGPQSPVPDGYSGPFGFYFPTGAQYRIQVVQQPTNPSQTCLVANGAGTVGVTDIDNVDVVCASATFNIGGTVSGLSGSGLTLRWSTTDPPLAIASNGAFVFSGNYSNGIYYNIVVATEPTNPAQTCTVVNGRGTVSDAPVTNIGVVCSNKPDAGRFVYVTNYVGNNLSAYTVEPTTGFLTPVVGSPYAVAASPFQLVPHPNRRFLYARSPTRINAYAINRTTGALTSVPGSPFTASENADLTIDPTGRFLYVGSGSGQGILVFSIDDATGVLTPIAGSPFATGFVTGQVILDSGGRFAYVANSAGSTIGGFAVSATTGALTPIGGSPFMTTGQVTALAVDPLGRYVYGSTAQDTIFAGTIDATTGAITALGGPPVVTGPDPGRLAIDPLGRFLYAPITGLSAISAFTIDASTGQLAAAGPTVAAGAFLQNELTIRADGRFLYAANLISDDLDALEIDSTSGQLYSVPGSPIATAVGPNPVRLDPGGRWAYVSNAAADSVSVYAVDFTSGVLTPVAGSPFSAGLAPFALAIVQ